MFIENQLPSVVLIIAPPKTKTAFVNLLVNNPNTSLSPDAAAALLDFAVHANNAQLLDQISNKGVEIPLAKRTEAFWFAVKNKNDELIDKFLNSESLSPNPRYITAEFIANEQNIDLTYNSKICSCAIARASITCATQPYHMKKVKKWTKSIKYRMIA